MLIMLKLKEWNLLTYFLSYLLFIIKFNDENANENYVFHFIQPLLMVPYLNIHFDSQIIIFYFKS